MTHNLAPGLPARSSSHQDVLAKLRSTLRGRQYARRTTATYIEWATRFLAFYPKRHLADLDAGSVKSFLTHLAEHYNVAVNTQKQALNALVFLFQESKGRPPGPCSGQFVKQAAAVA